MGGIKATSSSPNVVTLNAYLSSSEDIGLVFSLLPGSNTGGVNFSGSIYLVLSSTQFFHGFMQDNISQGNYTVLAYNMDRLGRLQLGESIPGAISNVTVHGKGYKK